MNAYPLARTLGLLLALSLSATLNGQKMLILEKYGSAKVKKFYVGDELEYKLYDFPGFREAVLEDILVEDNLLVFPKQYVSPEDIEAFRYDISWGKPVGRSLMYFGLGWSFFAGVADLTGLGYEYRWRDAIVSGTAVLSGFLISKLVKHKTIRFGKRRRLRVIDVTPVPAPPPRP